MREDEILLLNRQTGAAAIPLHIDGEWYLFPLFDIGVRSPWRKGRRRVRKAMRQGELPEA